MATRGTLALTDPDDVERRIEEYFQSRMRKRYIPTGKVDGKMVYEVEEYMAPPTLAGLARMLDVTPQTLRYYERAEGPKRNESLAPIIRRAKVRAEEWWEESLAVREVATGAQFALRVNYGWNGDGDDHDSTDFNQTVIAPAPAETMRAIPKWSDEDDT